MRMLVTGASSGIGKAIYEDYRRKGHEVHGWSRRGPDKKVDFLDWSPVDLGDLGPIDVLVLNAGIMSFNEPQDEPFLYQVNFDAIMRTLRFQRDNGYPVGSGGSIIINASVSGVIGDPDVPFYAALKAGLINLTKSYAKILMPQGIRVNAFSCGFFKTHLCGDGDTPKELIEKIPMKREAQPEEILPVIDMLINCKYITGHNVIVDGGLSL